MPALRTASQTTPKAPTLPEISLLPAAIHRNSPGLLRLAIISPHAESDNASTSIHRQTRRRRGNARRGWSVHFVLRLNPTRSPLRGKGTVIRRCYTFHLLVAIPAISSILLCCDVLHDDNSCDRIPIVHPFSLSWLVVVFKKDVEWEKFDYDGAGYLLFALSAPRPFRLSESSALSRERKRGRVVSIGRGTRDA